MFVFVNRFIDDEAEEGWTAARRNFRRFMTNMGKCGERERRGKDWMIAPSAFVELVAGDGG